MASNLQYARDFDPYERGVSMDELLKVRRQLAKVMNQRMVRLEQTKSPITGESYDFGAYDLMEDYLEKQGRRRFSEVLKPKKTGDDGTRPWSKREIQSEILRLQRFEAMKSSRVAGMREIEQKRIATFTSATAGNTKALDEAVVTTKDFYDFLNSSTFEEITRTFDSEKLVEEYNRYAKRGLSKDDIVDALNTYVQNLAEGEKISVKGIKRELKAKTVEVKSKGRGRRNARSKTKKSGRRTRRV